MVWSLIQGRLTLSLILIYKMVIRG